MTGTEKNDDQAARDAAAVVASVMAFVDQAAAVAKDTYEKLSAYNRAVWTDDARGLAAKAHDLVDEAPEKALLDSAARMINDGGAIAFHLANRALETEVEDDRPHLTAESARFFRSVGELWLRSTLGNVTGSSDVASSERVKTVTFEPVLAGGLTVRHVSVINRGTEAVDAAVVAGDLVSARSDAIEARQVRVAGSRRSVSLAPGRNDVTVRVKVPRATPPGAYRGVLSLQMGDAQSTVVLDLRVEAPAAKGRDASQ